MYGLSQTRTYPKPFLLFTNLENGYSPLVLATHKKVFSLQSDRLNVIYALILKIKLLSQDWYSLWLFLVDVKKSFSAAAENVVLKCMDAEARISVWIELTKVLELAVWLYLDNLKTIFDSFDHKLVRTY